MTPQELAEASTQAMARNDKASRHMGMQFEHIAPGEATMSMVVADFMLNGHGICHGGFIFTLADSAFAFACNSHNQNTVAYNCNITFIAPGKAGARLTARAREISRIGRSGIYDVTVTDDSGALVAEFRGLSRTIKGTHVPVDNA